MATGRQAGAPLGRDRLCLVHGAVRDDAALAPSRRPKPLRHPQQGRSDGLLRAHPAVHHRLSGLHRGRRGAGRRRDSRRRAAGRGRHLHAGPDVALDAGPAPARGRDLHAPPVGARRQPWVQPVPAEHQHSGGARLRLRPAHHPQRPGRFSRDLQRVLRRRSPPHARSHRSAAEGRAAEPAAPAPAAAAEPATDAAAPATEAEAAQGGDL